VLPAGDSSADGSSATACDADVGDDKTDIAAVGGGPVVAVEACAIVPCVPVVPEKSFRAMYYKSGLGSSRCNSL
jgi:hypothetical protein